MLIKGAGLVLDPQRANDIITPSTESCYTTTFVMTDPVDEFIQITYDDGFGGNINVIINVPLPSSASVLQATIQIALINAGITFDYVFVTETDLGGGLFSYFFEIINCNKLLQVASFEDQDVGWLLEQCDTTPPVEVTNLELREDGSIELREDGFYEIRE